MKKIFVHDIFGCDLVGETVLYETYTELTSSGKYKKYSNYSDKKPNFVGYVDNGRGSYIQVFNWDEFDVVDSYIETDNAKQDKEFNLTHPTEQNMRTVQHALRMTDLEYLTEIEGNFKSVTFKII